MTEADVATANALKAQIDAITAVQAAIAAIGATGGIFISNGDILTAPAQQLQLALGDAEYQTQAAAAVTALTTALADAKTAAQAALTAL